MSLTLPMPTSPLLLGPLRAPDEALPTTPVSPRESGAMAVGDGTLVERARRGDAAATEVLFRRHAPATLALVTRLVGRTHDAEDVLQESLATALEDLGALRDPEAFGGWLRQIAVRQAHRYFRRRGLKRILGLDRGADDATLEALAAPTTSPEARSELRALDAVLASLPYEQRVAWCLRYVEGEQLDDVAAACGCSLATVKRRIAAADERVRAKVSMPEAGRE